MSGLLSAHIVEGQPHVRREADTAMEISSMLRFAYERCNEKLWKALNYAVLKYIFH